MKPKRDSLFRLRYVVGHSGVRGFNNLQHFRVSHRGRHCSLRLFRDPPYNLTPRLNVI
jgi:hypothetical protein